MEYVVVGLIHNPNGTVDTVVLSVHDCEKLAATAHRCHVDDPCCPYRDVWVLAFDLVEPVPVRLTRNGGSS